MQEGVNRADKIEIMPDSLIKGCRISGDRDKN